MASPLRTAVVGVGHLGRFHAQKYRALPHCQLVGVVDTHPERLALVAQELGVPGYARLEEILPQVDALSIAVPTRVHHQVARQCLAAGKHILLEKPMAATVEQAEELLAMADRMGRLLQVGYLERFNPALVACRERIRRPQFIESIRISSFLERGADVDVVLDLMSHDLDLAAWLVQSPLSDLHAVGVSVMTEYIDLANARLIFQDGCVANLTASRVSTKSARTMRLFQQESYLAIDFAAPSVRIYAGDRGASPPAFHEETLALAKGDALMAEVSAFVEAVRTGGRPPVTGQEGLQAMKLADAVNRAIARHRLP